MPNKLANYTGASTELSGEHRILSPSHQRTNCFVLITGINRDLAVIVIALLSSIYLINRSPSPFTFYAQDRNEQRKQWCSFGAVNNECIYLSVAVRFAEK